MKLVAKASIQIQKPVSEVYEAIIDPRVMSKYFIAESSGHLVEGGEVTWIFPEFPESFPVNKIHLVTGKSVSFVWDKDTIVNIELTRIDDSNTVVRVIEDGKEWSEENLKWLIENTEGWANFLACMKAWLEYGIQLRRGAFDFMRKS